MDGPSAEVENGMGGSSGGSGTTSSSRWNPTKEQISLLENLYKEGIRTPNAEQIEQITNRLRAYGQIEGKNVFYWFQNHKARQRQRQKQERNAYFNRFLHPSHPTFPSLPCQNVVRTPSNNCLPQRQSELGFYPQHPNVLVPGPISSRTENFVPMVMPPVPMSPMTKNVGPMMMPRICDGPPIYDLLQQRTPDHGFCNTNRKTLELFPLHPTGTSEGKTTNQVESADCYKSNDTFSGSPHIDEDSRRGNLPFFDFFTSAQGPRVSD